MTQKTFVEKMVNFVSFRKDRGYSIFRENRAFGSHRKYEYRAFSSFSDVLRKTLNNTHEEVLLHTILCCSWVDIPFCVLHTAI